MTPEQIAIVKANFAQVVGQKEVVGMLFYDRLFAIAPETKSLFKGDLRTQSRKLMDTLALAIGMLRDMPTLVTTLEGLAKRHVAYGVKDEHYAQVGDALLWTLQNKTGWVRRSPRMPGPPGPRYTSRFLTSCEKRRRSLPLFEGRGRRLSLQRVRCLMVGFAR